MRRILVTAICAATLAAHGSARAAVVAAPGYAARRIPTPGAVQGGVVRQGNALIVGQGSFGAGTERVVRLDGAVATTIATGFNSLGGFDLDGDTLYLVDNCFGTDFGCTGASTGDSLYAIPSATTRTSAAAADTSAVLPAGSITAPQDVLVVPGALLVADAIGVGAGRVVKVVGTTPTNLATGLDYLGGLATDGATLFAANLDGSFTGSVKRFSLAGVPASDLVGGLSGSYGVARDAAGNLLVTGGFTGDFSSSTLLAVDAGGTATERAHGFGFSADVFFDGARDAALVLDFGVSAVTAVCRDADGDAVCDADCTSPAALDRAVVKIGRQTTAVGDDTLSFKGQMTIPGVYDPVANGVHVLVDDAAGSVIADVVVPGGAYDTVTGTGWKTNASLTSWTYKNPSGVVGITKVKVKKASSTPGLVKFSVNGRKGGYPAAGAALPVRAVMTLDPAGGCALATFSGPTSGCTFNSTGDRLTCK